MTPAFYYRKCWSIIKTDYNGKQFSSTDQEEAKKSTGINVLKVCFPETKNRYFVSIFSNFLWIHLFIISTSWNSSDIVLVWIK